MLYFSLLVLLLLVPLVLPLSKHSERLWAIVCVLAFLFIYGGKYYNGWDWMVYEPHFTCVRQAADMLDIAKCRFFYGQIEPGFVLLMWLASQLAESVQLLYFIIALFASLALYRIFKKYSSRPGLTFAIYLAIFGWSLHMQVLRQGLAVVIMLYAMLSYIENGRKVRFLLLLTLASTFHLSAFVCLAVLFTRSMRRIGRVHVMLSLAASFVILAAGFGGTVEVLEQFADHLGIGTDRLAGYRLSVDLGEDDGISLGSWLRWVAQAPVAVYAYRAQRAQPVDAQMSFMQRACRLYLIGFLLYPALLTSTVTVRAALYFQVLLPFLITYAVSRNINMPFARQYAAIVPLVLLLAVLRDPWGRQDFLPFNNYFIDAVLAGRVISYAEAANDLAARICRSAPDRCF